VAIARALAVAPAVLVLDEALSALDRDTALRILGLVLELRARHGLAIVFISHDLSLVGRIADRVVVLDGGRIVEEGPVAEVLGEPRTPATRALVRAMPPGGDSGATLSL
jgi:peptide/nickel transport system ATP-binding protein